MMLYCIVLSPTINAQYFSIMSVGFGQIFLLIEKIKKGNGELQRIRIYDLCLRRGRQKVLGSLIGELRLIIANRNNIHGRDEVDYHTCLAAMEQFESNIQIYV